MDSGEKGLLFVLSPISPVCRQVGAEGSAATPHWGVHNFWIKLAKSALASVGYISVG